MASDVKKNNRAIIAELELLESRHIISREQRQKIAGLYPVTSWNVLTIIRSFGVLGAVSFAVGAFLLIKQFVDIHFLLEAIFITAGVSLFFLGRWLQVKKQLHNSAAVMQLLFCFCITGLTITLGLHLAPGSENWPALAGLNFVIFIVLAYLFHNRLVLIIAGIYFFVWFGGQTGYVSGWGAYWLGMNYPLRFIAAGLFSIAVGLFHQFSHMIYRKSYTPFSRVYIHFGLLVANLSLWMFSLFGYFARKPSWDNNTAERLLFTAMWFAISGGSIFYGLKKNNGIFRSYGLAFLFINIYTFYFQFIIANSAEIWFLHFLLIGGSLIGLGIHIEKRRNRNRSRSN